jgi:transposase
LRLCGAPHRRKGYDGLAALVEQEMGGSPLSGDLYLFVSRNRERAKVLYWDGSELCIVMKRLERQFRVSMAAPRGRAGEAVAYGGALSRG